MKRFVPVLLCMAVLSALFPAAAVFAADYDRSFYRYNDYVEAVTAENEKILNQKAQSRIEELRMDFPICVFNTLPEDQTLEDYADWFYHHNRFGFGEEKSGILLVVDLKNSLFGIYYFGEAEQLIGQDVDDALINAFREDCHNDDLSFYEVFDRYLDRVFDATETARTAQQSALTTDREKTDNKNGMPYWYPENTEGFTDFHGDPIPCVTDDAEIFTEEQEKILEEKIRAMRAELGISYYAFTDDDNHGLTPEEYSSDFLHFNGCGTGERYGAVVFYLSLDPDDRCWLTTSINSYEDIFTFDVTYEIDETVDADIRAGNYFDAFVKHADFCRNLFLRYTELPDWYPQGADPVNTDRKKRAPEGKTDPAKPRITDNARLFDPQRLAEWEEKLGALSEAYGVETVLFTDSVSHAPVAADYAADFYYYNGYGRDGILVYLIPDGGDPLPQVLMFGDCATAYDEAELETRLSGGNVDTIPAKFCKLAKFMLKHRRLPMTVYAAGFCVFCGLAVGLPVAWKRRKKLEAGMRVARTAATETYLVPGSLQIRGKNTDYLYSTVSRSAKPKPSDSSSSSSSSSSGRGGSTYTSGRSAGGSYSSGGRRF